MWLLHSYLSSHWGCFQMVTTNSLINPGWYLVPAPILRENRDGTQLFPCLLKLLLHWLHITGLSEFSCLFLLTWLLSSLDIHGACFDFSVLFLRTKSCFSCFTCVASTPGHFWWFENLYIIILALTFDRVIITCQRISSSCVHVISFFPYLDVVSLPLLWNEGTDS